MDQQLFDTMTRLEMSGRQQGILDYHAAKFVSLLAISKKAQVIVEVGSGVGYSTLWLGYAASLTGGRVISCELDEAKAAQAQANLAAAGLAEYVEVLSGDARELMRHRSEAVDLLFIDGDSGQYETYFDVVYKRMGTGSLIIADDVVANENELSDYVTYVQNHPNLESVTVPVGNGLEVSVKTTE
jgi:predicted O-methyltransferase YrrM